MPPIRLLLVDDHALFREGLAGLFAYQPGFAVVGEVGDADGALDLARRLRPDLVLMDIDWPDEDGVAATRRLKADIPALVVVMLTAYDDADKLLEAFKAGARGYFVKNIRSAELLDQLRCLADGEVAISRRIAARLLEEFRARDPASEPGERPTARELEVLQLVAARLDNKGIAHRLGISEDTVKNHLKSMLAKLHLASRRQAAVSGPTRGWFRPHNE